MALNIVAYDLKRPGQDYSDLITKLESYPVHWHMQKSVWLIGSDESEYDLATSIEQYLDANDELFVSRASPSSAWSGFSDQATAWLRKHL